MERNGVAALVGLAYIVAGRVTSDVPDSDYSVAAHLEALFFETKVDSRLTFPAKIDQVLVLNPKLERSCRRSSNCS